MVEPTQLLEPRLRIQQAMIEEMGRIKQTSPEIKECVDKFNSIAPEKFGPAATYALQLGYYTAMKYNELGKIGQAKQMFEAAETLRKDVMSAMKVAPRVISSLEPMVAEALKIPLEEVTKPMVVSYRKETTSVGKSSEIVKPKEITKREFSESEKKAIDEVKNLIDGYYKKFDPLTAHKNIGDVRVIESQLVDRGIIQSLSEVSNPVYKELKNYEMEMWKKHSEKQL